MQTRQHRLVMLVGLVLTSLLLPLQAMRSEHEQVVPTKHHQTVHVLRHQYLDEPPLAP